MACGAWPTGRARTMKNHWSQQRGYNGRKHNDPHHPERKWAHGIKTFLKLLAQSKLIAQHPIEGPDHDSGGHYLY